jgi:large subunit ribosomal protein L21
MYAIFEDGSRQYQVEEGEVVRVDFREAELGKTIEFDKVLLTRTDAGVNIGQPLLTGAKVVGEVVDHPKSKIQVQHFRRRKNYRRLRGHTQPYIAVKVTKIVVG